MARYSFREEVPLALKGAKGADAQVIGEALEAIADQNDGHVTPAAVVAAARAKGSPLHQFFEWDNRKAADAWRLDQARSLIRVVAVEPTPDAEPVRAFLSVNTGKTHYHHVREVLTSRDLQLRVLQQAERDLDAWQKRYASLEDVCELVTRARERMAERRAELQRGAPA